MRWNAWWAGAALVCGAAVHAQVPADLPAREAALAAQLRCVVCQNQTVAESQAPMAADMRREIRVQLEQGRSDAEVVGFFEQRYGAFVRYRPPLKASTWLLWIAPFLLTMGGLIMLWRSLRKRKVSAPVLTSAQKECVQEWLHQTEKGQKP